MEKQALLQHRLNNQLLSNVQFETVEETVKWMGAIQGQDYAPGLWAMGMRAPSLTKADIERSLEDIKIVRSWTMRHTIHFVAIEDLHWMVQLSKEKMLQRYKNHMKKEAGLEESILSQSLDVFVKSLEGKKLLSRPAIRETLETAGIDTSKQRLYHLLWHAAQKGLIFIGPTEGKQQTFGLTADWISNVKPLSREEALHKLTVRYLQSHGPATVKDFSWWAGLTQKEATLGFHLAESELFIRDESKTEYWYLPSEQQTNTLVSEKIHLIYSLDELLIGYKDRTASWSREMQSKLDPQRTGYVLPILLNGEVIGSWKAVVKKENLFMEFTLATSLEIPVDLLNDEAEQYSRFFGLTLVDVAVYRV
ncbi:AlkZ family DNA glycosylase [Desemzia sp. RIT804]|uniref:winged helix DNA-binding domain-containing protein n=1 Tax=Desemzia sp. RIT 804 TaxID=2810209 RepID=UPI0019522A7C|nr:winged helix DNA-binding domain-containing protein [Desemzia sp. RIT 804]MBM6615523.1 AlkZ family DNA glycosylase [Desemzia sp. RIT 804]